LFSARNFLRPESSNIEELEMKASGQDQKAVRVAQTRPLPPSRKIMRFEQPAPFVPPKLDPPTPSNATARHAVSVASSPGGIRPRQQIY
jgi:hypothetical protein